jgi:hypothetical protein
MLSIIFAYLSTLSLAAAFPQATVDTAHADIHREGFRRVEDSQRPGYRFSLATRISFIDRSLPTIKMIWYIEAAP